jgi:hypothetical protein
VNVRMMSLASRGTRVTSHCVLFALVYGLSHESASRFNAAERHCASLLGLGFASTYFRRVVRTVLGASIDNDRDVSWSLERYEGIQEQS